MRGVVLPLLAVLGLASPTLGDEEGTAAPKFDIRLERGAPEGARFLLTAEARISSSESVVEDEKEIESEAFVEGRVRLEAAATILGVNAEGGVTEAEYEVRSFSGSFDGNPVDEIPPGSVLRTRGGEEGTSVSLAEGELGPIQKMLLVQVLETAREEQPGDDDLFGTAEPQAIGATWPIRGAAAVQAISANGTEVEEKYVSGGSRVVERHEVAGIECLQIEGRLDVIYMKPPGVDESNFANARLAIEFRGEYPTDTSRLALGGKILSRLEIRHLLFEAEEEGELPIYHLTANESEKSFSIRPLEEEEETGEAEEESEGHEAPV